MPAPANKIQRPAKSFRKRIWPFFWVCYALALIASHGYRATQSDFSPRSDQVFISLPAFDDEGPSSAANLIKMSYVDSGVVSSDSTVLPTVVLLHGSPMASTSMMRMHRHFVEKGRYRVITPDLPGFEGSSKHIPDYSVRAHARYLKAMLDSLAIDQAHLVGYSMSGGVVIEGMNSWPERISSVVMLSAIGVQEMELLGDYHLNHSIHALQLGGLWLLSEGIPHFGWMDDAILGLPYARNFFDTDQRPLRGILSSWEKPMFILHGARDPLVPYHAAIEHHRIVPQSHLETFDDQGHGIPFQAAGRAVDVISPWLQQVDEATALDKSQASKERLASAEDAFDPGSLPQATGFSLYLLLFLIAVSTLISEDLASITAGLMAARGTIGFDEALIAAFAGILLGDILLYLSGRLLGRRIVMMRPFSWFISARKLERGAAWFEHKGGKVIIASRFIPGSRLPTYVAAGMLKAPFWKFLGYFLIATIFWTPFIVGLSTLLGQQILDFWFVYESYALWVLLGMIVSLYGFIHLGIPLFSHRGRRKLVSSWRRLTRWEFWPPFIFYPPVVFSIIRLATKHRSLLAFTAANPAIETGGFLGESKAAILDLLSKTPEVVARYTLITHGIESGEAVRDLMDLNGLSFPIVMKPDVGDRGHKVQIVRSDEEARAYLREAEADTIMQEFVSGEEFGLFFVRHPAEVKGTIISITEKQLIAVTGNGRHSLERLILDDERAVCLSPLFLSRHAVNLDDVLPEGHEFQLVGVGTHSRGALFLDGGQFLTSELEDEINRIATQMEGFYFGRFDIRVPSAAHLERGSGIKIMEVNGVSSEATHIYDPSTPIKVAYQVLQHQWKLAFEIGQANVKLGARVTSLKEVMRLIFKWKINPDDRPDKAADSNSRL